MNARIDRSRREFLKSSAVIGGGLVVAFCVPVAGRFANAKATESTFVPNAFLRVGSDDTVTVLIAHSEMGQGIWTALPMLIAEELDADWSKIRVEHAPAAKDYLHTVFGAQMTGGSSSVWSEFERYRQAGAAARAMLMQAAASRFKVPLEQVHTENGVVVAGSNRARYGELADDAGKLKAPDSGSLKLKEAKDWRVIGKPTKRLDTPEKVNGSAKFGMDVQFEGLLTALVMRAPVFGATVKSFDAGAAKAIPGVRHVVQVPTGVAVVADHVRRDDRVVLLVRIEDRRRVRQPRVAEAVLEDAEGLDQLDPLVAAEQGARAGEGDHGEDDRERGSGRHPSASLQAADADGGLLPQSAGNIPSQAVFAPHFGRRRRLWVAGGHPIE